MLLSSYSENRNKKFQIQGGLHPSLNLSGANVPCLPPTVYPLDGRETEDHERRRKNTKITIQEDRKTKDHEGKKMEKYNQRKEEN